MFILVALTSMQRHLRQLTFMSLYVNSLKCVCITIYLFIYFTCIMCTVTFYFSGAYVTDVTPDYGSLGGETRLTIYGGG